MSSILIVPIRPVDHAALTQLLAPLKDIFHTSAAIEEIKYLDPAFAFDTYRNQYNSTLLLAKILGTYPAAGGKVIGITSVDLFVPVLTYVFGEAQLDGTSAVVSSFRLHEFFYGYDPNPVLEQQRLLKETVHEIGHTFGLIHCHNPECVMHTSTSVEEIDLKSERFCTECAGSI
jgi:archaemetzincin